MTPSRFSVGSRDANEPEILDLCRSHGYISFDEYVNQLDGFEGIKFTEHVSRIVPPNGFYIQATEKQGCDLFFWNVVGNHFLVEVKDGSKPPSKRRLTQRETKMQQLAIIYGIPYRVVTSIEDMQSVLEEFGE